MVIPEDCISDKNNIQRGFRVFRVRIHGCEVIGAYQLVITSEAGVVVRVGWVTDTKKLAPGIGMIVAVSANVGKGRILRIYTGIQDSYQ